MRIVASELADDEHIVSGAKGIASHWYYASLYDFCIQYNLMCG